METNSQEGKPDLTDQNIESQASACEWYEDGFKGYVNGATWVRDNYVLPLQSELSSLRAENERLESDNILLAKSNQKLRIELSDFKDQPRWPGDL